MSVGSGRVGFGTLTGEVSGWRTWGGEKKVSGAVGTSMAGLGRVVVVGLSWGFGGCDGVVVVNDWQCLRERKCGWRCMMRRESVSAA